MLDLIAIGNISADLFFKADSLTQKDGRFQLAIGGKYMVDEYEMHVGGGGANVAIGARKHGLRTAVVGMIGNNAFRKSIIDRFKKSKVSTRYTLFNQTDANLSMILLDAKGERTIIVYESSHNHSTEEKHLLKTLPRSRAVYFGNLPDVAMQYRSLVMARLKKQDTFIAVNVGTRDCCRPTKYTNELLEHADLVIVNTHEFAELVKKDESKINFKKSVADMLPIMKDRIIVVTDSSHGSYCYTEGKVFFEPAARTGKILDTTGAGDAYTAGFLSSYLTHEDIQRAMKTGTRYARQIIAHVGAN